MKGYSVRVLPSSGTISMDDVRVELNRSGQISLNDTDVRALGERATGQISMSDLYGRSSSMRGTFLYLENDFLEMFSCGADVSAGGVGYPLIPADINGVTIKAMDVGLAPIGACAWVRITNSGDIRFGSFNTVDVTIEGVTVTLTWKSGGKVYGDSTMSDTGETPSVSPEWRLLEPVLRRNMGKTVSVKIVPR